MPNPDFRDDYSRDTSGENNYHNTSSFDDDILMDLDTRGGASTRLDKTHDDLHKFRQRIDNNVEQQREYSEMMHALQNKVIKKWWPLIEACRCKSIASILLIWKEGW